MVHMISHIEGKQPIICTVSEQVLQWHRTMWKAMNEQSFKQPFGIVCWPTYCCNSERSNWHLNCVIINEIEILCTLSAHLVLSSSASWTSISDIRKLGACQNRDNYHDESLFNGVCNFVRAPNNKPCCHYNEKRKWRWVTFIVLEVEQNSAQ